MLYVDTVTSARPGNRLCKTQCPVCWKNGAASVPVPGKPQREACPQCSQRTGASVVSIPMPRHRHTHTLFNENTGWTFTAVAQFSLPSPWLLNTHTHSLEERKEQWHKEAEERRSNAPDPAVPAGHTLMDESERQETLKSLKESMSLCLFAYIWALHELWISVSLILLFFYVSSAHRTLVAELLSLPLRANHLSLRARRACLDCRLSEIEEAVKIFSRDKVYVKNDS